MLSMQRLCTVRDRIADRGFYMQALIPLWGYMPTPRHMMTWLCLFSGVSSLLESTPARYTVSTLASCQQDSLIAPCNIYLCLCMPEQTVYTAVAVQQDDLFGVHDHPAWQAHSECDVIARHRAILILLSLETLFHLISEANDSGKSHQFGNKASTCACIDTSHVQAFGPV